jgi:hypothetical protein
LGDPSIEEDDGNSLFSTGTEQIGPELRLRNEKKAGLDFFDGSPDDEGMVDRDKKDLIRFREVGFRCLIPSGGHCG